MAKCMQHVRTLRVIRVSNKEAKKRYQSNNWKYISKSDYQRSIDKNQSKED